MLIKPLPVSGLILAFSLGCSASLFADPLVANGGFEEPSALDGCVNKTSWFYCHSDLVPGWKVEKRFSATEELFNLEFHKNVEGIPVPAGERYAELASHPGGDARVMISQDITVPLFCALDEYTLSYKARQRRGDDALEVKIDGDTFTPTITRAWGDFSHDFYPTSDSVTISFAEIGPSGTLGTLLDEVALVRKDSGPSNCEVAIDIKFCSDPNGYNCKKRGVLPVTIFGTDVLDVNDIDLTSLQLCDANDIDVCTSLMPVDWSVEDRGTQQDIGASMCAIEKVCDPIDETFCEYVEMDYLNPDGFDDIDVAFDNIDVKDSLLNDFCLGDKGLESDSLVIVGNLVDGSDIYSVPNGDPGTDVLWKANK
jgi:hypothetical protein